jgi:signal transduction histidine kinase
MRRVTSRFVLLIASAAVAPLMVYGLLSMLSLKEGTEQSVSQGNLRVATQAAAQIKQFVLNNQRVLKAVGLELRTAGLQPWQQARILKDYVLNFPEFREISLFSSGRLVVTSRMGEPRISVPDAADVKNAGVYIAPLQFDDDGLPKTTIAMRVEPSNQDSGWIVAEITLEELWRMVDSLQVGQHGYALLLAENQRLIAHGNPDKKRFTASDPGAARTAAQGFAQRLLNEPTSSRSTKYTDEQGVEMLAVAAPVLDLPVPWVVIVEQPTEEAFRIANTLQRQLLLAIGLALLGTVILGWFWGRSFITRIFALTRATRAIAEGRLDERVNIPGRDEIHQLGDAFNSMADRLVQLQEDVRKQERQAMFGRIAAGLVHDLSHPIQSIVNNSKLIQRMFDDAEYRETFRRTIDRESSVIKRVLDDLRNIARPIPMEHFPIDIDRSVNDVAESLQQHAETAGLTLRMELGAGGALVEGDIFALGRVYRNLIINAIQATAPGGLVAIATEATNERVHVRVYDTGCGIAPDRLVAVFEDFVTTKRRGLGLGLAISKKIVEQLGGQISVASEVGKGTTFVLDFPRARARPIALVAG